MLGLGLALALALGLGVMAWLFEEEIHEVVVHRGLLGDERVLGAGAA